MNTNRFLPGLLCGLLIHVAVTAQPLINFEKNGKWGYTDSATGKVVVPGIYDETAPMQGGYGVVYLKNKAGLINSKGKLVLPVKYAVLITPFSEGRLRFQEVNNGKYGLMDTSFKVVLAPLKYDFINEFSEGLSKVSTKDKYGAIDINGKLIVPVKYDDIAEIADSMIVADSGTVFSLFNYKGIRISSKKYHHIFIAEGIANCHGEGYCDYIRPDGSTILTVKPVRYGNLFSEGLAAVSFGADSNFNWGYINKEGKLVIDPYYEEAGPFENGKAKVKRKGVEFYINKMGRKVE